MTTIGRGRRFAALAPITVVVERCTRSHTWANILMRCLRSFAPITDASEFERSA